MFGWNVLLFRVEYLTFWLECLTYLSGIFYFFGWNVLLEWNILLFWLEYLTWIFNQKVRYSTLKSKTFQPKRKIFTPEK
jgi:hypothetical protein